MIDTTKENLDNTISSLPQLKFKLAHSSQTKKADVCIKKHKYR